MMKKTLLLAALAFFFQFQLKGQESGFTCAANEYRLMGDLVEGHPERLAEIAQAREELEQFTKAWEQRGTRDDNQYVIPVVFHIIHDNGPENISNEQIFDAMRVINEDWNQQNSNWPNVQPEFLDRVGDMGVTFKLAQRDPSGNCTNGITRTRSVLTHAGDQSMKNLIQWPRHKYLNIWVAANAGGAAGYSMYPSGVAGAWGAAADGIVVLSSYVGSIGTSSVFKSHTVSHEIGHWLNLKHLWGDSNQPGLQSNCNTDDEVADTPNTIGWDSCTLRGMSCGSLDNVENFMEYSYCSKMFTNGQAARVHAALNSTTAGRNNLWSASNLASTGVLQEPELCSVEFMADRDEVCVGETITFTDMSYSGVTEWNWTFPGGNPSTATTPNVSVTYAQPGQYNVTLSVGDGEGSIQATEEHFITVLPAVGEPLPVLESFEASGGLNATLWKAVDLDGDGTFDVTPLAAYTGSKSLRLVNLATKRGNKDELLSGPIDITADAPAVISFRYAFAKRSSSNSDALRIYVSRDCGLTWGLRRALIGDALATVSNQYGSFTPAGPEEWGYNETSPIGGLYEVSNLMVKFVFESDGGNNLWLDDINIHGATTGINELSDGSTPLLVMPNPVADRVEISTTLHEGGPVQLRLLDVVGRTVRTIADGNQPAGQARWVADLADLPGGMYFLQLRQGSLVQVAKVTKQ